MKTLNSKSEINRHIERYYDLKGSYVGFSGIVDVNDSKIYVNTASGKGYDKVVKKLKKLVDYLANKYHVKGNSIEDNRQNIMLHILEGIPKYDPEKNTKLSTFLQMRVERRLINDIRNENRLCKNATALNTQFYMISCQCGNEYVLSESCNAELSKHSCSHCGRTANGQRVIMLGNNEVSLDSLLDSEGFNSHSEPDIAPGDIDVLNQRYKPLDDSVITMHDIGKWLKDEDPRVVKIIELVCFEDYSVSNAAKQVGLTGAGASLKLKNLKNNEFVREILGR